MTTEVQPQQQQQSPYDRDRLECFNTPIGVFI